MILNPKQTTVGYRCARCGGGVLSAVNLFALSADMLKLKCSCGESEMTVVSVGGGKVRVTIPCMLCPQPHQFTLKESLFFGKELFVMQCPYTDVTLACVGESELVKGELARSELELMDLMESMGYDGESGNEEELFPDPQVQDIVMFVINDLDAEGKIYCKCDPKDNGRQYDAEIRRDGVCVTCKKCGASRLIPTDSGLAAHSFLNADSLYLE